VSINNDSWSVLVRTAVTTAVGASIDSGWCSLLVHRSARSVGAENENSGEKKSLNDIEGHFFPV